MGELTIRIRKPEDARYHVFCETCRTDRIALTHNEARNDALQHRQWHLDRGAK